MRLEVTAVFAALSKSPTDPTKRISRCQSACRGAQLSLTVPENLTAAQRYQNTNCGRLLCASGTAGLALVMGAIA